MLFQFLQNYPKVSGGSLRPSLAGGFKELNSSGGHNMLITSNKQIRGAYATYCGDSWRKETDIYGAYDRPSSRKIQAWEYCKELMRKYDGRGIFILGHNCMAFSVGFVGYIDGLKYFFYITKDYDRAMPLEKVDENTGEVLAIC